jgi:hypothetical protein
MSVDRKGVDFEGWSESLRAEYEVFLRQTWEAQRVARRGHWIEDLEEHVHQAGEEFRRKALEKLLQAQIEEEQKSFSPSGGGAAVEQGVAGSDPPHGGGSRGAEASGVAAGGRRAGRTCG